MPQLVLPPRSLLVWGRSASVLKRRVGAANLVLPNLIGVHLTELQTKLDHRALKV